MGEHHRFPRLAEGIVPALVHHQAHRKAVQNRPQADRGLHPGARIRGEERPVDLGGQPADVADVGVAHGRVAAVEHGLNLGYVWEVLLPDDPAVGEGLVEGLRAGVVAEVGRVHRPEQADILPERHRLAGREVERRIPVQQAVQGEQRLGAGSVQLRQVHQGGPAQRPRDVTVLPTTLGASEAVPRRA